MNALTELKKMGFNAQDPSSFPFKNAVPVNTPSPGVKTVNEPSLVVKTVNEPSLLFSYFKKPVQNVVPIGNIGLFEIYNMIKDERNASSTRMLRTLTVPVQARGYKARNFDYCCFSGVFTKRCEAGLILHSGLLTIDFDHVGAVPHLMRKLINDENFTTALCFISPSGDGLKWIIQIDINAFSHFHWFLAVQNYIRNTYNLEIDKSGKDVSRCCFIPYDPTVYLNNKLI